MVVEFLDVESPPGGGSNDSPFDNDNNGGDLLITPGNNTRSTSESGVSSLNQSFGDSNNGDNNNTVLEKPTHIRAKSEGSPTSNNNNNNNIFEVNLAPPKTRTSWTKISKAIKLSNVVKTITSISGDNSTSPSPAASGGAEGGETERKHSLKPRKSKRTKRRPRILKEASFSRGRHRRYNVTNARTGRDVSPPQVQQPAISIVSKKPEDLLTQSTQVRQAMGFTDFDESGQNRSLSDNEEELFTLKGFEAVEAFESEPDFNLGDPIHSETESFGKLRNQIGKFINNYWIQMFVTALIVANAIVLGSMTYLFDNPEATYVLEIVDLAMLCAFTLEISMQLFYLGIKEFVKNGWMLFDFCIITLSWVFLKDDSSLSVFRSFRIFRLFALVSRWTSLRRLFKAVGRTMPKMGTIFLALMLFFYVFCVLYTSLYWNLYPEFLDYNYFGRLDYTFLTLFQFMTLDSWTAVVRQVMVEHPYAWLGFIVWIVITAFFVLNLVVAVICESLIELHKSGDDMHQSKMLKQQQKMMEKQTRALMGGTRQVHALQREVLANQVAIGTTLVQIMKVLKDETRNDSKSGSPDYYMPTGGGYDAQNSVGTMETGDFEDATVTEDDEESLSLSHSGRKKPPPPPPPPAPAAAAPAATPPTPRSILKGGGTRTSLNHEKKKKNPISAWQNLAAKSKEFNAGYSEDSGSIGINDLITTDTTATTMDEPFGTPNRSRTDLRNMLQSSVTALMEARRGSEVRSSLSGLSSVNTDGGGSSATPSDSPMTGFDLRGGSEHSAMSSMGALEEIDEVSSEDELFYDECNDAVVDDDVRRRRGDDDDKNNNFDVKKLENTVTTSAPAISQDGNMDRQISYRQISELTQSGSSSSSNPDSPVVGGEGKASSVDAVRQQKSPKSAAPPPPAAVVMPPPPPPATRAVSCDTQKTDNSSSGRRSGGNNNNPTNMSDKPIGSIQRLSNDGSIQRSTHDTTASAAQSKIHTSVGRQRPRPPPSPTARNKKSIPSETMKKMTTTTNTATTRYQNNDDDNKLLPSPRPPPSPTAKNKKSIPSETMKKMTTTTTNTATTRDQNNDDDNKLLPSTRTGRPPPRGIRPTNEWNYRHDHGGT